jgi:hypothetical protein
MDKNFTPDELDNLNLQKVNEELKRQQNGLKKDIENLMQARRVLLSQTQTVIEEGGGYKIVPVTQGVGLRDYLAGQIVNGIYSNDSFFCSLVRGNENSASHVADYSYKMADLMMKTREVK